MPLQRRLPKRGFVGKWHVEYQVVNLEQLAKLEPSAEVTPEILYEKRIVRNRALPVKLLGTGDIAVPLKVKVHAVSKTAKQKLEKAGGAVELVS
jgi:large subunit ribosomal protein L15